MKTENVLACFKYQDAGTEKTLDFMKTEDFFKEITTAGGKYRFNSMAHRFCRSTSIRQ